MADLTVVEAVNQALALEMERDERVLVFVHLNARGKTSGLELGQVQTKAANLFHLRRGQVGLVGSPGELLELLQVVDVR